LKALGYLSEDVAQFRTFRDQRLGFECEFVTDGDGDEFQCVPKQTTSLIFLDAACTQPATWTMMYPVQVGQWFIAQSSYWDSGNPVVLRRTVELGEEVYPEGTLPASVYELQGTACVANPFPPAKSIPAINRLIPHSASELSSAKRVSVDAGGGLRLSHLLGADGSQLTLGTTTADGKACAVQPSGECVPTAEGDSGPFPTTQRTRLGSGSAHVDLFTSEPGAGRSGVPVARYPAALDFLDSEGERCQVTKAVDGTLRCAPLSFAAYLSDRWSDPACTQELYYGERGTDAARHRAPMLGNDGLLASLATVKLYDGPAYRKDLEACIPAEDSGALLLQLDQRIEATSLPVVTETTL
jgi:hypothetical protein